VISSQHLRQRVLATPSADLLPRRVTEARSDVPERLELIEAQPLGEGLWLLLLSGGASRFAAPIVDDGVTLRRAVSGDGAAEALIARLAQERPSDGSSLHWQRFDAAVEAIGETALLVDQTHESVVVGDRAVVKWMVRAEETPAPKIVAHLAANGFSQMPQPWGYVSWDGGDGAIALAIVTEFLSGASDGWTWCVQDVGSFAKGEMDLAAALVPAAQMGELLAHLHGALSTSSDVFIDPVEQATRTEIDRWLTRAHLLLEEAVASVAATEGAHLRDRRDQIEAALCGMGDVDQTPTMPIHGDLHVGQILRWSGGYAVNDFDGNPVLPSVERSLPQSPARDVAGMLQSLDHVGRVVLRRVVGADPAMTVEWIAQAQREFLSSYTSRLAESERDYLLDQRLLLPFCVEQELREFLYAEQHMPRWRYVPDGAIRSLFP
jgi:maltokinase